MVDFLFGLGEAITILALLGLVAVLVFLAMTALKLKTSVMDNAGRLYKRPLAAGKSLAATGKGIAQQEAVRGKRIAASAATAGLAVKDAALNIKDAVQGVHPEELKPVLASVSNASRVVQLAAKLSQVGARQRSR